MSTKGIWGVLIADVVASRQIDGFRKRRTELLEQIEARQVDDELLHTAYAVSGYDEFQGLATHPWNLPRLVWELRRDFHPWRLRIGLGIGGIDAPPVSGEPLNQSSTGDAFYRAREALGRLDDGKEKFERKTRLDSGQEALDLPVNLAYGLVDSLLRKTTERQWETIQAHEEYGGVEKAAEVLNLDPSTVSRNLQRGFYWQILESQTGLTRLLQLHFQVQDQWYVPEGTNNP